MEALPVLGAVMAGLGGLAAGSVVNLAVERVPARAALRPLRLELWPKSWRRLLVQLGSAGLWVGTWLRFGADWALPAYLLFLTSLLAISLIDLEHHIIPNRLVYPTIAVSLPLLAAAAVAGGDGTRLRDALVGAALAWLGLLLVHLVSPAGMGFGDVRLAFLLGLFLGWLSLRHVLAGIFLGFLLGAMVGVGLVVLRVRNRKDAIPFGPFLAGGTVVVVLVGGPIIRWWLG